MLLDFDIELLNLVNPSIFPHPSRKKIQINKVFVDEMVGKVLYHLYFQGCPMNSALDSFDLFYLDNKNMKLVNVNFIYVVLREILQKYIIRRKCYTEMIQYKCDTFFS